MSNQMPGSGMFIQTNMAVPSVGMNQAANMGGSSMQPHTAVPLLPSMAFSARGTGVQSLTVDQMGPRLSGRQGTLDILLVTGPTIAAVAATGSITVVAGSNLVDGETFTLNDGVNPAKVFEFDSNASVTPGREGVVFTGGDAIGVVKAAVIAAINAATPLAITAAPGGGAGEVLLANDAATAAGNQTILETVANSGFIVVGMSGGVTVSPTRTVCVLTDDPTAPTRYIAIKLDSTNRPFVQITDALGTVVGAVTPGSAAIGASRTVAIRLAWDSANAVDTLSGRRASLRVERELVLSAPWTTNPTANWASFQPTHIMLGVALGADADFNGVISAVQVSNVVTP